MQGLLALQPLSALTLHLCLLPAAAQAIAQGKGVAEAAAFAEAVAAAGLEKVRTV
jgi:hypothetical protein